jgi:hypothetical protein
MNRITQFFRNCILRVESLDGTRWGTGFYISRHVICTCRHVAAAKGKEVDTELFVRRRSDYRDPDHRPRCQLMPVSAEVAERWDIAVYNTGSSVLEEDPPRLLEASTAKGNPFQTFGYLKGFEYIGVPVEGIVGDEDGEGFHLLREIDSEGLSPSGYLVGSGMSGAPVWDKVRLGITGMIKASEQEIQARTAYMIPAEKVAELTGLPLQRDGDPEIFNHNSVDQYSVIGDEVGAHLVVSYLKRALGDRRSWSERLWIYRVLSTIGGPEARKSCSVVKRLNRMCG